MYIYIVQGTLNPTGDKFLRAGSELTLIKRPVNHVNVPNPQILLVLRYTLYSFVPPAEMSNQISFVGQISDNTKNLYYE